MNATAQVSSDSPEEIANILPLVDVVVSSVERRLPSHVSREDLASAGKIALVEAMRRFEGPKAEARAYCFTRVRGAVFDELRRLDPLSRRTRAQVKLVQQAAQQLEASLGRLPSQGELSQATGMREDKLRKLDRITEAVAVRSLNEENAEGEPIHQVADLLTRDPVFCAEQGELSELVSEALEKLSASQAFVIRRYHLEEATLEDIAAELRLSRERVRQLRIAAEKRLKSDLMIMAAWAGIASAA